MKAWKAAGFPIAKRTPLPPAKVETIDKTTFKKNFDQYCVLDIRMRRTYSMGLYTKHLNDEMNALSAEHRKKYIRKIPLPHLTRMSKKVPFSRPVVVVDYKGRQAPLAARYLKHIGHDDVYVLEDGLMSFER
jgi:rhodanese-related sulfurtransferase